jgi:hypothetical protein
MPTELPKGHKPTNPGNQKEPETPAEVELDREVKKRRDPDALDPIPGEPAALPVI